MQKMLLTFLTIFLATVIFAQSIPAKANTIIVRNISFKEVCSALLDAKYSIEKKDTDLETVRTEPTQYPKFWNATYIINIRVKDSTAYISGTLTVADGTLWKNEVIYYHTNKKGEPFPKSLFGYPFSLLNEFALSFKKDISYEKQ